MKLYKLDKDHNPVRLSSYEEFGDFENTHRVDVTTLKDGKIISTVFLGIDHNFSGGKPILFETMVFPNDSFSDLDCNRYCTWDEAVEGHKEMVAKWGKPTWESRFKKWFKNFCNS